MEKTKKIIEFRLQPGLKAFFRLKFQFLWETLRRRTNLGFLPLPEIPSLRIPSVAKHQSNLMSIGFMEDSETLFLMDMREQIVDMLFEKLKLQVPTADSQVLDLIKGLALTTEADIFRTAVNVEDYQRRMAGKMDSTISRNSPQGVQKNIESFWEQKDLGIWGVQSSTIGAWCSVPAPISDSSTNAINSPIKTGFLGISGVEGSSARAQSFVAFPVSSSKIYSYPETLQEETETWKYQSNKRIRVQSPSVGVPITVPVSSKIEVSPPRKIRKKMESFGLSAGVESSSVRAQCSVRFPVSGSSTIGEFSGETVQKITEYSRNQIGHEAQCSAPFPVSGSVRNPMRNVAAQSSRRKEKQEGIEQNWLGQGTLFDIFLHSTKQFEKQSSSTNGVSVPEQPSKASLCSEIGRWGTPMDEFQVLPQKQNPPAKQAQMPALHQYSSLSHVSGMLSSHNWDSADEAREPKRALASKQEYLTDKSNAPQSLDPSKPAQGQPNEKFNSSDIWSTQRRKQKPPIERLLEGLKCASAKALSAAVDDIASAVRNRIDRGIKSNRKNNLECLSPVMSENQSDKRPKTESTSHALLEEIRNTNAQLIDTQVEITQEEFSQGTIVKCSFRGVSFTESLRKIQGIAPSEPLLLQVPDNYPKCSLRFSDKLAVDPRSDVEGLSVEVRSRLRLALREISQPWSVGQIARAWDSCTRSVVSEFAQQFGGGSFRTKYGAWEIYQPCP